MAVLCALAALARAADFLDVGAVPSSVPTVSYEQALQWDMEIAAAGETLSPTVTGMRWIISAANATNFHPTIEMEIANNCIGIINYNNLLYAGWRSAPFHFASNLTQMFIASSADAGQTWSVEKTIYIASDVREPFFVRTPDGGLLFSFFEAGTDPLAFSPVTPWRTYLDPSTGQWSEIETWATPTEVPWQYGWHNGSFFVTSYMGSHYDVVTTPNVTVFFNTSVDAVTWTPTNPAGVYQGGASETGWEFDLNGTLWAVLRNEDGDSSGWGSRIARATPGSLGHWSFFPSNASNVNIFESPRMFRVGSELFLVARGDPNGPYWNHSWDNLPWEEEHDLILAEYSLRAHNTSIWQLNTNGPLPSLNFLLPLVGCGDTAFPSIIRVGKYTVIIANYSSPPSLCANWSWIEGQLSPNGTAVYLAWVDFTPA